MVKGNKDGIQSVSLQKEMEQSYLAYSMAVLVGRALPDVYDGLKPVQRRVLTAMKGLGLKSDGPYKKAARVDGETLGKYHPHGSVYGAMVTLAAPHGNNHRLIDGHGNWGSETDNAAAARYTECRLTAYTEQALLTDFGLCDTRPNYDGSLQEPVRLEARLPHLLVGGSEGIGVGYATNVPQHNLRDVVKATVGTLEGKTPKQLAKYLIPDFPSGCQIVKDDGLLQYLETGRGTVRQRALSSIGVEKRGGRKSDWDKIVFTCLPYQVSTEKVGAEIKKLVDEGRVGDIHHLADETDRTGQRLVVYTKAGKGQEVLDFLYAYTSLDKGFPANNTVICNNAPVTLAPLEVVSRWLAWRDSRLLAKFEAEKLTSERRLHIVQGLLKALSLLDKVIAAVRKSADKAAALKKLMGRGFGFSEAQSEAILQLRLQSLTGMDSQALEAEASSLQEEIAKLEGLLDSKGLRDQFLKEELEELGVRHGNKRVCQVVDAPASVVTPATPGRKAGPKTRYPKIDSDKGIVNQQKGPRGSSLALDDKDKLIVLSRDGVVKRLPARHNGPCFDEPVPLAMVSAETKLKSQQVLAVWVKDGAIWANLLSGEELCRTTSKGKRFFPEGACPVYVGTDRFKLQFDSKRKKPKVLDAKTVKARPMKGPGTKICSADGVVM